MWQLPTTPSNFIKTIMTRWGAEGHQLIEGISTSALKKTSRSVRTFVRSTAAQRVVRDVLVLFAILTFLAVRWRRLEDGLPLAEVTLVMALFSAMAGVAAALLAVLAAWLTDGRRFGWLGMALGCYSLVAIPTATIGTLEMVFEPTVAAMRFVVHVVIVGLLLMALLATPPPTGWRAISALLGGAGVVAGGGALGMIFPTTTYSVTSSQPLQLGVALSTTALALAIATVAVRRQAWALWYVALGFAVIGLAHTGRLSVAVSPVADLGLRFSAIRLGGVALVLWGTLCLAWKALTRLDHDNATREEELRLAGIRLARTAERDHELRSGLAGLAGATTLLRTDGPDAARLGTVVASELNRLDDLLRASVEVRSQAGTATYAVAPVLDGLVTLRRSSGMDLCLDMDPDLRATGSPATLTQVITNLIGNAARHAPGSPVRISAMERNGRVIIGVRDFGPGVPPGHEHAVFEPGTRDRRRGGVGLGLHISRSLLSVENGSIFICPTDPGQPGCAVVVELPATAADNRTSQDLSPAGVPCSR